MLINKLLFGAAVEEMSNTHLIFSIMCRSHKITGFPILDALKMAPSYFEIRIDVSIYWERLFFHASSGKLEFQNVLTAMHASIFQENEITQNGGKRPPRRYPLPRRVKKNSRQGSVWHRETGNLCCYKAQLWGMLFSYTVRIRTAVTMIWSCSLLICMNRKKES